MEPSQTPRARVVLLGASNVTFGLRKVAAAARARLGAPIEILSAQGCGRSYGRESRVLGRALPAIVDSGLWRALEVRPKLPTYALATDLGNDLAYGSRAEQIEPWIVSALERLDRVGAEIVLTGLPVEPLQRLPAWKFRAAASLLFPLRPIERERVLAEVVELQERIARLCRERGLVRVDPRSSWYGRDPIHVTRAHRASAWGEYVAGWKRTPTSGPRAASPMRLEGRPWYERVRVFGFDCGRPQPSAHCADGTTLSLY